MAPRFCARCWKARCKAARPTRCSEHNLRPALPPKVEIVSFGEGADLEYKMLVEILPEIPDPNFADLGIERLVVEVPPESVEAAIERIAEQQRKSTPVERPAQTGDILVVDVDGRVGGQEIPGAAGKDRQITLGSGGFIPGFEEQLIGAAAGEHRTVRSTFPEDYAAADLAGKEAEFAVDVKEVRERAPLAIDDELGKAVGLETLAELRQEVQQQMERDYALAARQRLKRTLLDKLAERYDFGVPPGMVELEFNTIWAQHQSESAAQREGDEPGGEPQPRCRPMPRAAILLGRRAKAPSRRPRRPCRIRLPMMRRRLPSSRARTRRPGQAPVRGRWPSRASRPNTAGSPSGGCGSGCCLPKSAAPTTSPSPRTRSTRRSPARSRRLPGYERQVLDFYRKNPEAVANLRAPIFEDKVVDFIVELAKVEERRVSPQELLAMPDPDGDNAAASGPPASAPNEPSG